MKYIKLSCIFILPLMLLFCGKDSGTDTPVEKKEVIDRNTLVIGVENIDYYPHYSFNDGTFRGFAVELFNDFAAKNGYKIIYRPLPVKRLFNDFITDAVQFKYPDHPVWGQDLKKGHKITYSTNVVRFIDGVLVVPNRKGAGKKKLKTLGTVMGFTPFDFMKDIKSGAMKVQENNNFLGLLKQTLANRNDGAYINVDIGLYQLDKTLKQPSSLIFDPALPHTRSYYHLSSIKRPDVIKKFDEYMVKNADFVKQLKSKFEVNGI